MDFNLNRRRKTQVIIPEDHKITYPHDVSLYKCPPGSEITLSEFEDLALDRLKLLRTLEFATNKGLKPHSAEWKRFVHDELQKENLKKFSRLIKSPGVECANELDFAARRADHISHFILRLAYCRSDDLRKWFASRELDLFKMRFMELSPKAVKQFLEVNELHYKPISEDEKSDLREELNDSTAGLTVLDNVAFYKVPFTEVSSLIKARKVFVKRGFAYVPSFELVTCIATLFRMQLTESLAFYSRRYAYLDDDRINSLLKNMHTIYTGEEFVDDTDSKNINPQKLNQYSKEHYPLCMRHIHEMFRNTHHLKHQSRLQYLLYLKGIGLSFENCMQFWKEEFTKIIDGDKFEKNYAYLVKHSYGKVGSMVNYSPFSCIKIITGSVGPGDHHGCPFKHWDPAILKQKLTEYGISGVTDIVEMAQNGHYQLACGKYFEYTHNKENKDLINHPNQYFKDSMKMAEAETQSG